MGHIGFRNDYFKTALYFIIEIFRLTSREREGETKNMKNSTEMYLKASSVAEIEEFHMFIYIYHALNYWDSLN